MGYCAFHNSMHSALRKYISAETARLTTTPVLSIKGYQLMFWSCVNEPEGTVCKSSEIPKD
jgi:hypothetical protein